MSGTDAAHDRETHESQVASRATLTAEEREAGSDDPTAQAEAILAESEERARERELAPTSAGERRRSEDTVDPTGLD